MASEVFVEFSNVVVGPDGRRYHAHACGAPLADNLWEGWLEFVPIDGGPAVRSSRETTQPNRTDAAYWATGLTPVYLEGALRRALNPSTVERIENLTPVFNQPAPSVRTRMASLDEQNAVLDPFSVYEKEGEALLRRQLAALASWHLVNIIEKYELSDEPGAKLSRLPASDLIERIVIAVQ